MRGYGTTCNTETQNECSIVCESAVVRAFALSVASQREYIRLCSKSLLCATLASGADSHYQQTQHHEESRLLIERLPCMSMALVTVKPFPLRTLKNCCVSVILAVVR